MRYYKIIEDGFIIAIGVGGGNTKISAEEYSKIMAVIKNRPKAPEGYDYRLTEALEWELYEMTSDSDPELTEVQALGIITGGVK